MKKFLSAFCTVVMGVVSLGGLIGCGSGTMPEYEDNKEMIIAGWDSPMNTKADYQFAKDMGLTHMFIDQYWAKKGTDDYAKIYDYCDEAGLKAIVGMGSNLDGAAAVDEFDYSVYPAVDMVNYWDEPSYTKMDDVAAKVTEHNTRYAGKDVTFYVNLDPGSGGNDEITSKQYVDEYCEKVLSKVNGRKILATDVYPLLGKNNSTSILSTWLPRLEVNANAAKKYGAEQFFFVQTYWSTLTGTREIASKQDISYQFYVNMAYGVQHFAYFTYTHSFVNGFKGGCVERHTSTTKTKLYDWAKELNSELASFDHVFLSFDWNGTMPILGTANPEGENDHFDSLETPLTALDCAKSVTATQDTLVGQFKDKNGNHGLMVANYTDPADEVDTVIDFEFKKANRAIVYSNGKKTVYEVKKNKLQLKLLHGEGAFVIPVKV